MYRYVTKTILVSDLFITDEMMYNYHLVISSFVSSHHMLFLKMKCSQVSERI